MIRIQEWIHKFEVGEGTHVVRLVLAILAFLALTALYDIREYKNFSTAEAMDTAQLARNLAAGDGFTTQCIRPLSIHLVEQHQIALKQRTNDFSMLKSSHPDLANPPVYPLILAGLMKVLPFQWEIPKVEVPGGTVFFRYQPEILIAFFNQALLIAAILMVFRLARRLFDATVAWISVFVLVQRIRTVHNVVAGDISRTGLVPGVHGTGGARRATWRRMVRGSGVFGWSIGWNRRADAIFVWLAVAAGAGVFFAFL